MVLRPANVKCLICGRNSARQIFNDNGIPILRCLGCGHVFSGYDFQNDFAGYYREPLIEPSDQYWWNEARRSLFSDFCRRYLRKRSGRLLDVGCGLGFFIKKASSYPNWEVTGYEVSPIAVAFARDKLGLSNVHVGRVEDLGLRSGAFDLITLWDVLEHIPEPDKLLIYLRGLLKPNGRLLIHTPNIAFQLPKAYLRHALGISDHLLEAQDHAHMYSQVTLTQLLRRAGFNCFQFIHLRPAQGIAGEHRWWQKALKNIWYYLAVGVAWLTGGRINYDNLSVLATSGRVRD